MTNAVDLGVAPESCMSVIDVQHRTYGLELEVEFEDLSYAQMFRRLIGRDWEISHDQSLRTGYEYHNPRSPHPTKREFRGMLRHAGDALESATGVKQSWRAATQLHIEVGDMTPLRMACVGFVYATLEPYLFAFVGRGRDESNFCIPWWKAPTTIGHSTIHELQVNLFPKYSALNVSTLSRFGTLEFRHLETPVKNAGSVLGEYFALCVSTVHIGYDLARSLETGSRYDGASMRRLHGTFAKDTTTRQRWERLGLIADATISDGDRLYNDILSRAEPPEEWTDAALQAGNHILRQAVPQNREQRGRMVFIEPRRRRRGMPVEMLDDVTPNENEVD